MGATCLFYRNKIRLAGANQPTRNGLQVSFSTRWCALAKSSPVPESLAKGVIGAEKLLRCEGQICRCPLSRNHRDQMMPREVAL